VCPTELHEIQSRLGEFERLNVQVIAASTDSWFSHIAWLRTPKRYGGIQGVTYPILSDFNKTVSQDYGVLLEGGMALRGTFLIDREGILQSLTINNLSIGRNVDETLRTVRALQFCEEHGEVCPANWTRSDEGMRPSPEGLEKYFSKR
jgi:peroxiredoxin 2/4